MKTTKEELIVNQQLEIAEYKKVLKHNNDIIKRVKGNLISIGQPLNDNCLQFNKEQLSWAMDIYDLLNQTEDTP